MKTDKINIEEDEPVVHTVAQLKGRRLRMVRALTGFSRQELYEKIGIATSTMDTWESGRVELTEKSTERICQALRKVGIYCAHEWLLTGAGVPPRTMDNVEKSVFLSNGFDMSHDRSVTKYIGNKIPPFLDEDIRRELSFFINLHENALFHILEEDFLNFQYKRSDCVAGIESDVQKLVRKVIIAQLHDGKTILCKLQKNSGDMSKVFLSKSKSREAVKISKAAEILWHRRPIRK